MGISGADADVLAGDYLVELKAAAAPLFEREYARQLVGHAALAAASGVHVARLGVYFARHALLSEIRLRAGD